MFDWLINPRSRYRSERDAQVAAAQDEWHEAWGDAPPGKECHHLSTPCPDCGEQRLCAYSLGPECDGCHAQFWIPEGDDQ